MDSWITRRRRPITCILSAGPITLVLIASMCQGASLEAFVGRRTIHHGKIIEKIVVPPSPPPPMKMMPMMAPVPSIQSGTNSLPDFPALNWCYGCSATSAAMMFGYYDAHGYPGFYVGPTNGGVFPTTNAAWGYGECPLSASHLGIDGRATRGHVDDYWIDYGEPGPDPYSGEWTPHGPPDCTADFMGTSQWAYGNTDGETCFYSYTDGSPLDDYTGCEPTERDGCHGMRLFAEARGYSVLENYTQRIYGYAGSTTGFTFADYKAEINAGRPVLIQLAGHSMIGFGYKDSGSKVSICDTWDHSYHEMTWGGSYDGMAHWGVTVLRLDGGADYVTIDAGPAGTPNPVASGAQVTLTISASSSEGRALSYAWTAVDDGGTPAGAFNNPSSAAPTWTAPENRTGTPEAYTIAVTVTSTSGATASGSYTQWVDSVERTVDITDGPTSGTNPCASEGTTVLSVTAEENLGGPLEYTWAATDTYGYPAGSFTDPHSAQTTWRAPENPGGTDALYRITVVVAAVADAAVHDVAELTQYVSPGSHEVTITSGPSATPNPAPAQTQVQLSATAECNQDGHGVEYLWSVAPGPDGRAGALDAPTAQSAIWTPPVHNTDSVYAYQITLTVTCVEDPTVSTAETLSVQVQPVAHTVEITSGPAGTPNPVASGGGVQCSVTGADSRDGHALAYEWSATAGSFSNPHSAAPVWSAPANLTDGPVEYEIAVTVSCVDNPATRDTASFIAQVNPVDHAVQITAGPTGTPNPVAAGGEVRCSVAAVDTRGHAVGYLWSVTGPAGAPTGSFDSTTSADPVWTAPSNETGQTLQYQLWVACVCADDPGVVTTASFIARVNPSGHAVTVDADPTGSPNPAESGAPVQCAVTATDTEGHSLTYHWTAHDGLGSAAGAFDDPAGQAPIWAAPQNRTDDVAEYAITVTATCALDPAHSAAATYTQRVRPVAHSVSITDGPRGNADAVDSLQSVECTAAAADSREGHALSCLWSATGPDGAPAGSFDDPTLATATWTAPVNSTTAPVTYTITLTVTCVTDPSVTDTGSFTVQVLPACRHTFAAGTRMIGIPVDLPAGFDVSTVLGAHAVAWDPSSETYTAAGQPTPFRPGLGYWGSFTQANAVIVPGSTTLEAVTSSVADGWNIICSPYDTETALDAVLSAPTLDPFLWTDQGNGYELVGALEDGLNLVHTSLQPWWGYWARSHGAGQIEWRGPSPQAAWSAVDLMRLGAADADAGGWQVQLVAEAAGRIDACNYCGLASAETAEMLTIVNPPALGQGVDLFFTGAAERLAADIRPLSAAACAWQFTVTASEGAPVRLSLPDLSSVPAAHAFFLHDLQTDALVNLRTSRSYEYTSTGAREFELQVRPQGASAVTVGSVIAQSAGGMTTIGYTLSADADVIIEVRNIAGRLIARIPRGLTPSGLNTATWSECNLAGARVPAGTYLCSITAAADDGTRTSALRMVTVRR